MVRRLIASAEELSKRKCQEGAPDLTDCSLAVEFEDTETTCVDFKDHHAFHLTFGDDVAIIGEIDRCLLAAEFHINVLYTYRSVSKALPMVKAELAEADKVEVYKQIFYLLKPEIDKIKACMEFHDEIIILFSKALRLLTPALDKHGIIWRDLVKRLIKLIDGIERLNQLKETKACLKNDFSRFSRTFQKVRNKLEDTGNVHSDITAIQQFLSDPRHPHHIIVYHLKEKFQSIPKREELLALVLSQAVSDIENRNFVTPHDKHLSYRALCTGLYLADSDDEKGQNVFYSAKGLEVRRYRNVLKKLPFIPVFYDMVTTGPTMLSRATHWDRSYQKQYQSHDVEKTYILKYQRNNIQKAYTSYSAEFLILVDQIKHAKHVDLALAQRTWDTVLTGFRLLTEWCSAVREQTAYKYLNPCSNEVYEAQGGKGGKAKTYEQATRFNYNNEDKYTLVEVIGMIKGIEKMMIERHAILKPVLAQCVYEDIQKFLQVSLVHVMRKSKKYKKTYMTAACDLMRQVLADVKDPETMRKDYEKDKDQINKELKNFKVPQKSVMPTDTQVLILRRLIWEVSSPRAAGMQGGMFGGGKDLKPEEIKIWHSLYNRLEFFKEVKNYNTTIRKITDMAFLWYREFYLEMTGEVQFPTPMSLPWIMTEYSMTTPSLMPNLFLPLSVYNDAADAAIRIFRQRYLFDEIEQEVNLVWDQLVYTLASQLWAYYKNIASKILIDKTFERTLKKQNVGATMNYGRFISVLQQTHLKLLGRTIDVSEIVTQHINNQIRENISSLIERFESQDMCHIVELESLLNTLTLAMTMMRSDLPAVDAYEDVFREVNEDTTLGSFQGRLFIIIYQHLVQGLFKKFVYNETTQRFVQNKQPHKKKLKTQPVFLWGPTYTSLFQSQLNVYRGFFGFEHIKAMLNVLGDRYVGLTIDECIKNVQYALERVLGPYVHSFLQAMDPMNNADPIYGVLGIFGLFQAKLRDLSKWKGKEELFQHLREVGNCICFFRLLGSAMSQSAMEEFQCRGFYEGVRTPRPQEHGKGDQVNYSEASSQFLKPKQSPFNKIITDASTNVSLPPRTRDFLQSIVRDAAERAQFFEPTTEGWLLTVVMESLYGTLESSGYLQTWRGPAIPPVPNGLIDHKDPKDFSRFWTATLFLFLVPDEGTDPTQKHLILSDREFYGDGWSWGGAVILYLLGIRSRWSLLDFTNYLRRIQATYPIDLNPVKKSRKAAPDPSEMDKPFVKVLLEQWDKMDSLMGEVFSILESHYPEPKLPIRQISARYEWSKPKMKKIGPR